jgi:hypothetical protein
MITPKLYEGLDPEERKLWHSHDFEVGSTLVLALCLHLLSFLHALLNKQQVRSGMLIMPNPMVPNAVWEVPETEEMKEVVGLYGKTFHFWQVDRGDILPLGKPELMMSYTKDEQVSCYFLFNTPTWECISLEVYVISSSKELT